MQTPTAERPTAPPETSVQTYLVADLFCGAGGSSTGAQKAITDIGGEMDLVAINHWNTAIATHSANHPTARHLVEDVSLVDPEAVVDEGRLDLLMASPECRYFSRARGGKPIHDQGRMNPWAVMNWLTKLDIRCVLIENVPEFVTWGRLLPDGKPDKAHRGEHFQAWYLTFQSLGYTAEWRMLNAADYGDATTRTRFFLLARKDGRPITWPEPSHAKGETGMFPGRQPWRGAKEIIDWNNQGRSLLDDPKYLKKPLSPKTRQRIARGLERFGGPLAQLYIRLLDLSEEDEPELHQMDNTTLDSGFIMNRHGDNGSDRIHSLHEPMPTATTRGAGYLVQAEAEPFVHANRNNNTAKDLDSPIPSPTTANGGGSFIIEPVLTPFLLPHQRGGTLPKSTQEPVPCITTKGPGYLVAPSIIQYYGNSYAQAIGHPVSAITARARKHALVNPTLIEYYGTGTAADVELPLPTITTKSRHGLANPTLIQINHGNGPLGDKGNERRVQSVDDPLGSITTVPGIGLVQPLLVQTSQTGGNGCYCKPTEQPLPTLTTKNDMTLVTPLAEACQLDNFAQTLQKQDKDPRRLILIDGQPYLLDIRFRMLQNSELAKAMGFDDEETTYEFTGTVTEITKQIGNAVPVHLAAALVKASLDQAP